MSDNNSQDQNSQHIYHSDWIWVEEFEDSNVREFTENLYNKFYQNPERPIIIHVNTYGGDVHGLLSMIDAMDSIRSMAPESFYFITVTTGKAVSAGAVLLACGDYRFATPNSSIMVHQINGGLWGSHPANKVEFIEMSRLNYKVLTLLHEKCNLHGEVSDLEETLNHNLYLEPEQAREFGIIDIVGYPKLTELRGYELSVLNGVKPPKEDKKPVKKKRRRTKKKT